MSSGTHDLIVEMSGCKESHRGTEEDTSVTLELVTPRLTFQTASVFGNIEKGSNWREKDVGVFR